ncbi:MAG: lipocalin family protein [Thermoflexibacter sp.]|jgi:hypothetical protein|nr:lipocalin family protein [Thermoflexibacter sp.]
MKLIRNLFSINVFVIFLSIVLLTACGGGGGGTTPKTLLEILSKNWRITRVTINGTVDSQGNYSGYRIVLQQNGTYVVTLGNSPANIVINPTNNGRWEIADNETSIIFDKGTPNEFKVTLVSKTESAFSVRFKVPRSINKTEPEYVIDFAPVS